MTKAQLSVLLIGVIGVTNSIWGSIFVSNYFWFGIVLSGAFVLAVLRGWAEDNWKDWNQ